VSSSYAGKGVVRYAWVRAAVAFIDKVMAASREVLVPADFPFDPFDRRSATEV